MPETKITFCRLCEATCGLEVDVEDNRVLEIRPDPKHVVSRGYACVKGTRYASVQHSPDRLTQPIKREGGRWRQISWQQALSEIADKIRTQIDKHGPRPWGISWALPAAPTCWPPCFAGRSSRGWVPSACTAPEHATP